MGDCMNSNKSISNYITNYMTRIKHVTALNAVACSTLKQRVRPHRKTFYTNINFLSSHYHTLFYTCKPEYTMLSNLKIIEAEYLDKKMPKSTYDAWMEINGGPYQIGSSMTCSKLWKEYLEYPLLNSPIEDPILPSDLTNPVFSLYTCTRGPHKHLSICWNQALSRNNLKLANKIFAYSSSADKSHTAIDVASILWHGKSKGFAVQMAEALDLCSLSFKNVTVCFILLQAIGNPDWPILRDSWKTLSYCGRTEKEYVATQKLFSVALRRTRLLPDATPATLEQVTSLAYCEMATGRSRHTSDWLSERCKRTKSRLWLKPPTSTEPPSRTTNDTYLAELKETLRQILPPLVKHINYERSFAEFSVRRQVWVSSGSAAGGRLFVDGKHVRVNKHVFFENTTSEEMASYLSRIPEIVARGSEKLEPGKNRPIYGIDIVAYVIISYVIDSMESHFYALKGVECGLSGMADSASVYRRFCLNKVPGMHSMMLDYADFNLQHTLEAQAAVFEVILSLIDTTRAHPDVISALRWCITAHLNQYAFFPNDPIRYKVTQGLFSGNRATGLLNTILNIAYFETSKRYVLTMFSLRPVDLYSIHHGDDVWITNRSRLWCVAVYSVMLKTGFVLSYAKQLFDDNVAEFLRVYYTANGLRGFLSRALASLIVKPIQGVEEIGPAEAAQSLNSQINILYRRGFSLAGCEMLWDATVPYAASSCVSGSRISIPKYVLCRSFLSGGLDLGYPMSMASDSPATAPLPVMPSGSAVLEKASASHMSADWVSDMSDTLCRPFNAEDVRNALHRTNMCDSLRPQDRYAHLLHHEKDLCKWSSKLNHPVYTRNYSLYVEYFNMACSMRSLTTLMSIFNAPLLRHKTEYTVSGILETIFKAIASSAFRDISTCRIAMSCSILEAVDSCISECPDRQLSLLAARLVKNIIQNTSSTVFCRLISGVRLGLTTFHSEWHPTVLSWIQLFIAECSIVEACAANITTSKEWDLILARNTRYTMSNLHKYPFLSTISKY